MTDEDAFSDTSFRPAVDFMQQEEAERVGMNWTPDDHRDADPTEMGDQRFTRVVDHRDGPRPSFEIGCSGFEKSSSRDHGKSRPGELLVARASRGAFVDRHREFSEDLGKFGELAAALE